MSKCTNKVSQYVPSRCDYREVKSDCGSTGIHGQLLLCDDCEHTRERREANSKADNTWLKSAGWGEI